MWETGFRIKTKTKTKLDYNEEYLKFIPECIKQGSCWHIYINNYLNHDRHSYALRQISKQRSRLEILHCVYTGKDLNICLVDNTVTWVLRQWVYRDYLFIVRLSATVFFEEHHRFQIPDLGHGLHQPPSERKMLVMGTFSICIQLPNDKFAMVQTHCKQHTLGLFSLHL